MFASAVERTFRGCAAIAICGLALSGSFAGQQQDSIPIEGGERLAWTQRADSVQALRAHIFVLYVDGRPSTLVDHRCFERFSSAGFLCSAGLPPMSPGLHTLEMTAILNGVESPRSSGLIVTLTGAGQLAMSASLAELSRDTQMPSTICATGVADECYDVQTVARGLSRVTALSTTSDGRLLFSDGGPQLRVLADGVLVQDPVLTLQNPRSRIVGLAVDPQFTESRFVFVAWTEPTNDGGTRLNVSRYRELANALGEGAAIVTGFPFANDSLAPLAMDGEGQLYVALPEDAVSSVRGAHQLPLGGAVLRVDRDGLTPRASGSPSPVVSYGYARPTSLSVDPTSRRIWITGNSAATRPVSSFDVLRDGQPWPILPTPTDTSRFAAEHLEETALTFAAMGGSGVALFRATGRLFLTTVTPDSRLVPTGELALSHGVPIAVANASIGSWYVAVLTEQGTSAILLLARRR